MFCIKRTMSYDTKSFDKKEKNKYEHKTDVTLQQQQNRINNIRIYGTFLEKKERIALETEK